jgi:phosphoglucomutase
VDTDKDGIILGLLAAEITAVTGRDPGEHYRRSPRARRAVYERIDAPARPRRRRRWRKAALPRGGHGADELAGEPITPS